MESTHSTRTSATPPARWTPDPTIWAQPEPDGAVSTITARVADRAPGADSAAAWAASAAGAASAPASAPGTEAAGSAAGAESAALGPTVQRSPARLLVGLATAVAVAGLAFAGGRLTAPAIAAGAAGAANTGGATGGFGTANGGAPPNGGPGGAGTFGDSAVVSVEGTVTAVTATSITVTLASGSTVQIPIDPSTTFHAAAAAASGDVTAGETVSVQVARGAAGATGTATDVTVTAP